ncbi:STAS domain-containing protein [Caldimonas brevitalea]|uniref:STAS domain-containing protein n=1 Tax=Caldimonas brevitalea TaxID=413882 RepID=A0A0G3BM85_9BURK|nr:STAS domain-containing protein [Caldimonas brevitalea]AKJ27670.1 hypothetical protein AAW51_0979 [Caldimonas brevitalea]
MSHDPHSAEPVVSLRLEGELTIYRAVELKQALFDLLKRATHVELDLSGVTEIDTCGVQLLIALKQQAVALHRELRLVGHTPCVVEAFGLLDLTAYFGDPLLAQTEPRGAAR